MTHLTIFGLLLKDAARGWFEHRAQRLGASLAFYTTLALAPLTMTAIAVAGYFYGADAARGEVVGQLDHLLSHEAAVTIEGLIQRASEPRQSRLATVLGVGLLLFGATGVFAELKDSLDVVWEVKRKPGIGLWTIARTQLLAFALVVGTGFLLLVSLLLTTMLTAFMHWLGQWLPGTLRTAYLLDILISFLVITGLFAMIFKLLPDVTVSWRDVWVGSAVTALLFMLGKSVVSIYIAGAGVGSVYGAAGSLVVVLVWTYYSSQILFFGAELIRAYAKRFDPKPIVPTELAVPMSDEDLTHQGMPDAAHHHSTTPAPR